MTTTTGIRGRLLLTPSLVSKGVLIGLSTVGVICAQSPTRSSAAPPSVRADATAGAPVSHAMRAGSQQARIDPHYGRLPLNFEPNVGQTDPRVDFVSRGRRYVVFLVGGAAVLALRGGAPDDEGGGSASVVRMQLAGAAGPAKAIGRDDLPGKANYFIDNDPKRWHTNVPTYGKVAYPDVYPGIDLVYCSGQQSLEYDFIIRPGARPASIVLDFQGADAMEIDTQGDLVIRTGSGVLRQSRPVVYQQIDDQRQDIASAFVRRGPHEIGFEVGAYDTSRPLVIDPAIVYSTYLGGSDADGADDVAIDATGNAYVVGSQLSVDFPTTIDAFQPRHNGGGDRLGRQFEVSVTKLDATGSTLLYSTYLGGSHGADFASAVAVDAAGRAYVAGSTFSDDFPTTPGAFDRSFDGIINGFVTRLNETGSALIYSTYLGADSGVYDIAVDAAGSAYVTGSTGADFPTTPNAFDTSYNGGSDAFVTKIDATGSALIYSTYLGGSRCNAAGPADDAGNAIAIDSAGNAYVTGSTTSADFPTTPNAFDTTLSELHSCVREEFDGFVTKIDPTGSVLVYSTYLGGGGDFDSGSDIAVDVDGSAYVTGTTNSSDFPTTPGAFDATARSTNTAFVTRLDASGSTLLYSTRLGGSSGFDIGFGIVIDAEGRASVTGRTGSRDFPTTPGAFDTVIGPGSVYPDTDAFVTRLNASGTALVYSTYLGRSNPEGGAGIATDPTGNLYVVGFTASEDFPVTPGAFDTIFNGGVSLGAGDAFVVKISFADATPPVVTISGSPHVLWPPNGKFMPVEIVGTMTDDSTGIDPDTAAFHVVDEYGVVQPAGSIRVAADGTYSFRVPLEASRRNHDPDGRRYSVLVTVADRAGNVGSASDVVIVPRDHASSCGSLVARTCLNGPRAFLVR